MHADGGLIEGERLPSRRIPADGDEAAHQPAVADQLTGDLEFNSPQTLVAFALGITLFVLTLAMNIYALYIVRKYREQYE